MTPAPDDPSAAQAPQPGSGPGKLMPHGIRLAGRGEIDGMGATAAMFSNVIGRQPEIGGRMVVDNTGLTGNYNFTLKWTPDLGGGASGPDGGGAAPDPTGPSLFTAIQEQLGLKLDATKAPVDTLVIDSVEMPSGN